MLMDWQADGQTTDAEVIGILIAHLGAFGSGELINIRNPALFWRLQEWIQKNMKLIELFHLKEV